MSSCARCHRVTDSLSVGVLRLCSLCGLKPPCGEYQHDYGATATPGQWVCLRCGSTLASQALSTEVVLAPQAPYMDFDC